MTELTLSQIKDAHETLSCKSKERPMLPKHARRSVLKQLQKAINDNEEKIFQALKDDLQRPTFEAYVAEIAIIKDELNHALRSLGSWSRRRVVKTPAIFQPGFSYIEPSPKGLVLIISPWNYPIQLALVPFISAVAAGNCVIVKPSEISSASARLLAQIINDNLDTSCFRVILGDKETAIALLDLPFDHIFYTGSTNVGREIMKKAAVHLTPVTLEMGGKSPVIIDDTADLNLAAKRIMWSKCLNSGQTCLAPDYLLMHPNLVDDFARYARQHLKNMFGDNIEKNKDYGRIINQHHFLRLINLLKDGTVFVGGKYNEQERFIEPTILTNIKEDAKAMSEEIFGPILPIVTVKSLKEAVDFVSARPHPLALYVFSTDKDKINFVLNNTLSGGVAINDCVAQVGIINLPFGGVRESGIGNYHGIFGFETFSHMRSVYKRANVLDNAIRYPPYSEKKMAIARLAM